MLLIDLARWKRPFLAGKPNRLLIGSMALVLVNTQVNVVGISRMVYNS